MTLAIESLPERAKVFRKFRRGKELGALRPDYQDLLLSLKLWIWLARGADQGHPSLVDQTISALIRPQQIERFGGLSLGESSYLVDSISLVRPDDERELYFLVPDPAGFYSLPIWVDHERNRHHRNRFNISKMSIRHGITQCGIDVVSSNLG
jgi:CRISPR-associated protein Cas5t